MLGYTADTATGRMVVSQVDTIFRPRTPRDTRCGLILIPGSGNPQGYVDLTNQAASVRLAAALAQSGIVCATSTFGGQTFANNTAIGYVDSIWAYMLTQYPRLRADKIALLGASMGGGVAARYAQLYPDKVAAVVGLIPLWDIVSYYQRNPGAGVDTAWGVVSPAALPVAADIAATATLARKVPHLAGYSSVDTVVLPAEVVRYTEKVGGTAYVTDTTVGHSDAAIGGMPISTVAQFLTLNGC